MNTLRAAAVVVLLTEPAFALTGAEFLQAEKMFAEGYAWGVLEDALYVVPSAINQERHDRIWRCVMAMGIDSRTFHSIVSAHIRNNPQTLQIHAIGAVRQTINVMCPQ